MLFRHWRRSCQVVAILGVLVWVAGASTTYARPSRPPVPPIPGQPHLGPPPSFAPGTSPRPTPVQSGRIGPLAPGHTRAEVVSLFNTQYTPALQVPVGWTGSVAGCVPGATSPAHEAATLQLVNYFRTMVGLPSVTVDATRTAGAQAAALIMRAEGALSHDPPPTWACYTPAGAATASASNLAINTTGPGAVRVYMDDSGTPNLGHRRWIIYPRLVKIGTGSTDATNALHVIGGFGVAPASPEYVPWPPAGFVPYSVVFGTWSFTYANANFANATVTMSFQNTPIGLTVVALPNFFGDNGISWIPQGLGIGNGVNDRTFTVNVNNVVVNGTPRNFAYDVTVIDPALANPVSCSPRPRPTINVVRIGTGKIQATITSTGAGNTLTALRFGVGNRGITNATVDVQGVATGVINGQTVNLPGAPTQTNVIVTRVAAGPATVPLTVFDQCGPWPTFVGLGTGVQ